MAQFKVNDGAGRVALDLEALGRIGDEDAYTILNPAANVLTERFTKKIKSIFQQHTGKLAASVQGFRKKSGEGPYMLVYPYGAHHRYKSRKGGKKGKGGSKNVGANEVAFVLEYGAPARGIEATHWMEDAMYESESEVGEAMQEGFDALCDSKGIGL